MEGEKTCSHSYQRFTRTELSRASVVFLYAREVKSETVTHIEVDEESRFKYLFLAFGVAIRGFCYMRKVVRIDGTFLKGQYRGVLLVVTAQDGNGQCYPLAWGIVDSENEDAWTWFLTQLKEVISNTDKLALISDRAPSIKKAISTVFEKAHHGACAGTLHRISGISSSVRTSWDRIGA